MRRNIFIIFIKTLTGLFMIGTIGALLIIYLDIDFPVSQGLINGYILIVFLLPISMLLMLVLNLRRLGWSEVKKRLPNLAAITVLGGILSYAMDRASGISATVIFRALTLGVVLTFGDVFFGDIEKE